MHALLTCNHVLYDLVLAAAAGGQWLSSGTAGSSTPGAVFHFISWPLMQVLHLLGCWCFSTDFCDTHQVPHCHVVIPALSAELYQLQAWSCTRVPQLGQLGLEGQVALRPAARALCLTDS